MRANICAYPSAVTQLIARLPSSYQRALRISGYAAALLSGAAALWLAYRWQLGRSQSHPTTSSNGGETLSGEVEDSTRCSANKQGLQIVETLMFPVKIFPSISVLYDSKKSFNQQYQNYLHVDGSPFVYQDDEFFLHLYLAGPAPQIPTFVYNDLYLPASLFRHGDRIKQNGESVSYLLQRERQEEYTKITLIIKQVWWDCGSETSIPFEQAFRSAKSNAQFYGRRGERPPYLRGKSWSLWQSSQSGQLSFVSNKTDQAFDLHEPQEISFAQIDCESRNTGKTVWCVDVDVPGCYAQDVQFVLNKWAIWVLVSSRLGRSLGPIKPLVGVASIEWKGHEWYRHFSVEQMKQVLQNTSVTVNAGRVTFLFEQPETCLGASA